MSFFGRLADMIGANAHALLDHVENPERLLNQRLRNLEEKLAGAKLQAARAIAAERNLRRALDQNRAAAREWHNQARLALSQGREDLARRALAHKIGHDGLASALEAQYRLARQLSSEVKAGLRTLMKRLEEARHRQVLLVARQRAAEIRLEVGRFLHDPLGFAHLDPLEQRLLAREDDLFAQADALHDDPRAELDALERKKCIEEEMNKLKREAVKPASEGC